MADSSCILVILHLKMTKKDARNIHYEGETQQTVKTLPFAFLDVEIV